VLGVTCYATRFEMQDIFNMKAARFWRLLAMHALFIHPDEIQPWTQTDRHPSPRTISLNACPRCS
jgi:hypothetical protein